MLTIIEFPGIPIFILFVYYIILSRLEKKYPIGDNSFLIHLSSLLLGVLIFTWIFAELFPYEPFSENPPSTEMDYHQLWNSICGSILSGALAIFLHFVLYRLKQKKKESNRIKGPALRSEQVRVINKK